MIRAEKFLVSRPLYAVDLASLRLEGYEAAQAGQDRTIFRAELNAVWFRRRKGVLAACAGRLWDYQRPAPADAAAFLAAHTDGRYGAHCKARWDGTNLWSVLDEADRARYKALLVPMLAACPEIPAGYSGWWGF